VLLMAGVGPFLAGEPTLDLEEMTVTADDGTSPLEHWLPASIAHTMPRDSLLQVVSQGGAGAQTDLSILGSSFSGAGLSLGGISLRHPQTEHFHSELALPPSILGPPRVLTGMEQALGAEGHLAGTVGLDLRPIRNRTRMDLGIGGYDLQWQNLLVERSLARFHDEGMVGAGAFLGRESAERLDYEDNDLDRIYGGIRIQQSTARSRTDAAAGSQNKEFGVRGYYGVNPELPGREEIDDSIVLVSHKRRFSGEAFARATALWRETEDHYALRLDDSTMFVNDHKSGILAATADGSTEFIGNLRAQWRVSAEHEKLDSSSLGDQERKRFSWQLIPGSTFGSLRVNAGLRGESFEGDSPALLPQAGIEANLAGGAVLYAAYTETVRQPSFTELNYESPGSLGNAGLDRQEARSMEAGFHLPVSARSGGRIVGFLRRSRNTVDWVKELPDSTRWVATDLGTVDTRGAYAEAWCRPVKELELRLSHAWIDKSCDARPYAARYVLDYPEHLTTLQAQWRVHDLCSVATEQTLRRQTKNPLRKGGHTGLDGSARIQLHPFGPDRPLLTAAVYNMWNDQFQFLPGQESVDRRVSVSLSVTW